MLKSGSGGSKNVSEIGGFFVRNGRAGGKKT